MQRGMGARRIRSLIVPAIVMVMAAVLWAPRTMAQPTGSGGRVRLDVRLTPDSIAIGDPKRNAVTAWQATRLPRSLVVDGVFAIHCDPEFLDGGVCLWGEGVSGLDAAFDAFTGRYLDRYLRQMHLAAT